MKLYVCWGTFPVPWPRRGASWSPGAHPCKVAANALADAGYDPEVIRVYSFGELPDITPGRREVRRLSGQSRVPVLLTDDGAVITGSSEIAAWAGKHPGGGPTPQGGR